MINNSEKKNTNNENLNNNKINNIIINNNEIKKDIESNVYKNEINLIYKTKNIWNKFCRS